MLVLMIALGGGAGAVARFHLAAMVEARAGGAFPWGTLAVNLTGSFLLGLILPLLPGADHLIPLRALLTVGLLGAFTTFSTFTYEVVRLAETAAWTQAVLYVAASIGLGLAAIAAGLVIGGALA